ncbi:MAG: hypothetical protein AAGA03_07635, partial [Planctomycetota bacterium]
MSGAEMMSLKKVSMRIRASAPTRRRRLIKKLAVLGCFGLLLSGSTGCTMFTGLQKALTRQDAIDDFMIGYRNQVLARKAWYRLDDCHKRCAFLNEMEAGFLAGYMEVAEGGNGCT